HVQAVGAIDDAQAVAADGGGGRQGQRPDAACAGGGGHAVEHDEGAGADEQELALDLGDGGLAVVDGRDVGRGVGEVRVVGQRVERAARGALDLGDGAAV